MLNDVTATNAVRIIMNFVNQFDLSTMMQFTIIYRHIYGPLSWWAEKKKPDTDYDNTSYPLICRSIIPLHQSKFEMKNVCMINNICLLYTAISISSSIMLTLSVLSSFDDKYTQKLCTIKFKSINNSFQPFVSWIRYSWGTFNGFLLCIAYWLSCDTKTALLTIFCLPS